MDVRVWIASLRKSILAGITGLSGLFMTAGEQGLALTQGEQDDRVNDG